MIRPLFKHSLMFLCVNLVCFRASAIITTFAEYQLGETGSLGSNNRPQDSSGNGHHFTNGGNNGMTTVTTGLVAPGSTDALDFSGASGRGFYAADYTSLATDNFALGLYVNPDITTGNKGLATSGNVNGSVRIQAVSGEYVAFLQGGDTLGTSAPFTAGTWVHLAVIRQNGTSTFYVDGVATGPGSTGAISHSNSAHLGVNPGGGSSWFDGQLDEFKVVEFGATDTTQDILTAVGYVVIPEPSTMALLGLAALILFKRNRSKR